MIGILRNNTVSARSSASTMRRKAAGEISNRLNNSSNTRLRNNRGVASSRHFLHNSARNARISNKTRNLNGDDRKFAIPPAIGYAAACAIAAVGVSMTNPDFDRETLIAMARKEDGAFDFVTPSILHGSTCKCDAAATVPSSRQPSTSSSIQVQVSQRSSDKEYSNSTTKEAKRNDSPATKSSNDKKEIPTTKSQQPNNQRNVMLHRLRSKRGRNLIDKYNVDWETCLGEGAYGSVHPARHATTGEKVALKKITKRYTDTSSFCRETDALLRIYNNGGHPNISGLRDMYEDEDHYYLVMDLVAGGEMFDHLIHYGAYSEADAAMLMREVASALAFLHGVGVVHADLKPENLLLCSKKRVNGTIKMIDFGCAVVSKDNYNNVDGDSNGNNENSIEKQKQQQNEDENDSEIVESFTMQRTLQNWIDALKKKSLDQDEENESSPQSTGTTAYWPPERFLTKHPPDHATDMWAVGVILYIMLTGVHPFDLTGVASDAEIAAQIKKDPSPPITPSLTSHLSPSAINLIKMLMDKEPADRLTADEMLQHPWIAGDEATTDIMEGAAQKLGKFKDLRAIIEAGIFSLMIENGSRDMLRSEYTPTMVYKEEDDTKSPASSVLKRAFEAFDEDGKGFVSAEDLNRVVTKTTGQELSDKEKKDVIKPFEADTAGSMGLSLSSFSKVCRGLKHKHYPRGYTIFRSGEEGDSMYFVNSGKVEIRTAKGKLVHILRHGDFFGEGSLLEENNRRFSTAKCSTPVDLIKIKRSDFTKYIENSTTAREALRHRWKARTLADAKAFIRLQTNMKSVPLKKGDIVYKEGDMGKSMYFVDEERGGELDVKHGDITVHKYGVGESFGESSLLMAKPRSSTVICATDECYLHEMMGSDFFSYLETSPDTKAALLNMCRKRLFKKAVKKYASEHGRGFSNDDLIKAFELADSDKNGQLELEEVRKLMHAMDPTMPEEDILELMNYINVGEEGKLNFRDFKRLFRSFEFQ